jgi:AraC family transcriptional regulator
MPGLIAQTTVLPAGGGPFVLPHLTIGVFGADQAHHRAAVGKDRAVLIPLRRHQGWILPAGAEGVCLYEAPMDLTTVSIEGAVLEEAGLPRGASLPAKFGKLDPVLLNLCLQAENFSAGGTLYRETMHRAIAAHVTQVLHPVEPAVAAIDDVRLRGIADWIEDHLAQDLSIHAMASLATMSATHFAKSFKGATGQSPLQYVIARRLEHALVLLRTTDLPVAEVAHRVGYNDVPRFGQHFKRRFGKTPGQARAH